MMLSARKIQVTAANGMMVFYKITSVTMNDDTVGENRTHVASNELMLAILPVPKKETTM
jgi:hypothetical protein